MARRAALILARGDPGLFDVFKRVTGAVVGGVARTFAAPFVAPFQAAQAAFSAFGQPIQPLPPIGTVRRPGGGTLPILQIPGARRALARAAPFQVAAAAPAAAVGGACPSGFHVNKSSYTTLAGFVPARSRCVRNRRRNLSNGRANSRALRRLSAWEKQDKRRRILLRKIALSAK